MLRRSSSAFSAAAAGKCKGVVNPCIVAEPLKLRGRGLSEEPVEQFRQAQFLIVQSTFI
jgi:hypothetical protein